MNFLSFALREGAVFSLNSTLALCVTWERDTAECEIGRSLKSAALQNFGAIVFSFCSFLLLRLTTRAPRHTLGCLAPCIFRPEDKILSSWRHTRVRHMTKTRKAS